MARTGVGYTEVAETAVQLIGQGRNPTVERVRHILGTGSSTTIANHLRQWKANQVSTTLIAAKENLPPEFVAMMKGLWERLVNHSTEQVAAIQNDHKQTLSQLQEELQKYKTNNQRWQQLFTQWQDEKAQLAEDQKQQLNEYTTLKETHISLQSKQEALLQQLQEKQERIVELQRLHHQVQANLEHYRESAREQRLLDEERNQQIQTQLGHTIQALKQELAVSDEQRNKFQNEIEVLRQSKDTLQQRHEQLSSENELIKTKLTESEKEVVRHSYNAEHWQAQYLKVEDRSEEQSRVVNNLERQLALLTQKVSANEDDLRQLQDRNILLTQEKSELAQGKAQLIGQIMQLQKLADKELM